MYLISNCAI